MPADFHTGDWVCLICRKPFKTQTRVKPESVCDDCFMVPLRRPTCGKPDPMQYSEHLYHGAIPLIMDNNGGQDDNE